MKTRAHTTRADVVTYFDECEGDYRWLWDLDTSLAMHAGYWDASTHTLADALVRQNEILAARAGIAHADRVLDAGCGVGGSAIYLATTFGCRVVGITISSRQARRATTSARARGLGARTAFCVMDYLETGFAERAFDVVWALESACYAPSKRRFLAEAARVLRPGGKLVLADGFAAKRDYRPRERRLMERCFGSWMVPGLDTEEEFRGHLRATGFEAVRFEDVTWSVLPSTRRLFLHSLYGLPLARLAERAGLRRSVQTQNALGARYSHVVCTRGLVRYGIFDAVRAA